MKLFLALSLLLSVVLAAESKKAEAVIDWEKGFYDTESVFKGIPDMVNMTDIRFKFRLTNWFLTGVERGMYNDTELLINSACFGEEFVTKLNELKYLQEE